MKNKPATTADYQRRINIVVEYIRTHLDETLDLCTLAEVSSFSPCHFHRIVSAFLGEPPGEFIARTRIEGELRTLRRSLLDLTENVIRLRNQLREVEIQADTQMQSRLSQVETHHTEFDPLEMDRYTRLQELTRMMAESVGDVTTVQQNLLKNLDEANAAIIAQARLNRELQQSLMSVRMVPFSSQTERLHRMALEKFSALQEGKNKL